MTKSNLIFLIGNEGTGHHLMLDIFPFRGEEKLTNLLLAFFDNYQTIKGKKIIGNEIQNFIAKNHTNHIEPASFPYNQPRNSIRRYDILEIYNMFKANSEINLFFIVTSRNIIHSTLSAYNRFHEKNNIIEAIKMQEDNLIYINSQLQLIPKERFIIIDYYNICDHLKSFQFELEKRIGLHGLCLNEKNVIKPDISKYQNHEFFDYTQSYFNDFRLKEFEFINTNTTKFI